MASVIGWTTLAIAAAVALVLISMLFGLPGSRGTLIGGPWVTLMLGFSVLNTVLLAVEIWVAHLVGPVTSSAADALSRPQGKIYLPYVITSGVPLLVWAAVLAVLAFGLIEGVRWLRTRRLPDDMAEQYRNQAAAFRNPMTGPDNYWYWSGLSPFPPPGDKTRDEGQGTKLAADDRPGPVPRARTTRRHLAAVGHHSRAAGHGRVRLATAPPAADDHPQRRSLHRRTRACRR